MKKNFKINENIGLEGFDPKKLKFLRADLNLTQEEMAESLGISKRTYRYVEDGEKPPSIKTKFQIYKLYGEQLKEFDAEMVVGYSSKESEELINLQRTLIDSLTRENELLREKLLIKKRNT